VRQLSPDIDCRSSTDAALIVATVDTHTSVAAPPRPRIRRRRWAAFNCASFVDELNKSLLMCKPPTDVDELFDCYNCINSDILDRLAPYGRTVSPWYDRECYVTKLKTRRLEKAYRCHPNPSALTFWRTQFNRQRSLYQNKFINHWSEKINSSNGKALWAHLNCLLTRPKITTTTHSANSFLITSHRRYDAFDIPHRATARQP